jgi:hypothetical protein
MAKGMRDFLAAWEAEHVRLFITWLFEQATAGSKRKRKLTVGPVRADVAALRALLTTARPTPCPRFSTCLPAAA